MWKLKFSNVRTHGWNHYFLKFMCLVILNQNIFPSVLQHLFSSLMLRAEQPVTHMRLANSKPRVSNQFPINKIKPRPTFVLVWEAVSLRSMAQLEKRQHVISCDCAFVDRLLMMAHNIIWPYDKVSVFTGMPSAILALF